MSVARTPDGQAGLMTVMRARPRAGDIGWVRLVGVAALPAVPVGIMEAWTALATTTATAATTTAVSVAVGVGAVLAGPAGQKWAFGAAQKELAAYREYVNSPVNDGVEEASTHVDDWQRFVDTLSPADVEVYKSRVKAVYVMPKLHGAPLLTLFFLEEYMVSSTIMGMVGCSYALTGSSPMLGAHVITGCFIFILGNCMTMSFSISDLFDFSERRYRGVLEALERAH